ncbi:SDR family oxidoreductase [Arenicella xantha]|uniref:Putative oxidoreductase n=1 Tax=Arenicella xantha TaxID=644221 RepID=A0A395JKM4_9GAMM|nr:SDR family NAD(P)-dependent oxidoreductase [Arenicella xantha]RBP51119.1 putative oxidoreductase [Arenicella xantha]
MNLVNKRILITGGTSGIGLEMVRQLCAQNQVIVISRSAELAEEVPATTYPVRIFQADFANQQALKSAMDEIVSNYDQLDVLINNAAIQNTPELLSEAFNYADIQREIDINFTAVCQLSYRMLPLLQGDTESVILNINTGLALSPKRSSAIYCATKGALNLFSQSLQYQLAETNISVQQAFLPLVDTNMTKGRGSNKRAASSVANEIIDGLRNKRIINDVGKAKLLRLMVRFAPSLARKIMRNS